MKMERGKNKGMLVNHIARLESALEERDSTIANLRKEIADLKHQRNRRKKRSSSEMSKWLSRI
jgi:uncharacterized small protein (DUF1192 family)